MSFNKRYISENNLKIYARKGINDLLNYIRKPDALIIQKGLSEKVCDIVLENKSINIIKKELKNIGFYEFE
jgi:hypothetical protein